MPRRKSITAVAPQTLERAMNTLLEGAFFPPSLQSGVAYMRVHDDCDGDMTQTLTVVVAPDSDVHVLLPPDAFDLRFRTYFGGGMSLRVRNALLVLAEAIRRDNEERPQRHAEAAVGSG